MKPKGRHPFYRSVLLGVLLLSSCTLGKTSSLPTSTSVPSTTSTESSTPSSSSSLPEDYHDTSAFFEGTPLTAGSTYKKTFGGSVSSWNASSTVTTSQHSSFTIKDYNGSLSSVPLNEGANTFYLKVVAMGNDQTTYYLELYRKYTYTIHFNSDGGSEVGDAQVEEGNRLLSIPTPTKTGYVFKGWGYDFSQAITGNISVKASWTAAKYAITLDAKGGTYSGESITSISVTYQTAYTLPDTLSRPGYEFAGWQDSSGTAWTLTGIYQLGDSITLYANWTPKSYTITYHLDGGVNSSLNPSTYQTSANDLYLFSPSKDHYAFKGWTLTENGDPTTDKFTKVVAYSYGDLDLYAHYEVSQYSLTYLNEDGTYLGEYWYAPGTVFSVPSSLANPTKASTAQYSYVFNDYLDRANGKYLRSDYISGGSTRATIYQNYVFYATYNATVRTYAVTFLDSDGTNLQSTNLSYGSTPSYAGTPSKTKDANASYVFSGWSPAITSVTAEATYTAQYTTHSEHYTVSFIDDDGSVLQTGSTYLYNDVLTLPANPSKAADATYTSYTFAGWDQTVATTIRSNATYKATYTPGSYVDYTITFLNRDNSVLKTQTLHFGDKPTAPSAAYPSTSSCVYAFSDWSPAITPVSGNATYTAQYVEHTEKYTVRFLDGDNNVLQSDELLYLTKPSYRGSVPEGSVIDTETAYLFNEWSSPLSPVTQDIDFTPSFVVGPRPYQISFYDEDGTILLHTQKVGYGSVPVYDGTTPSKSSTSTYSYLFKEWSPTLASVTGAVSYQASYNETLLSTSINFGNYPQTIVAGTSDLFNACTLDSYFTYNGDSYYCASSGLSAVTSASGVSVDGYAAGTNRYAYFFKVEPLVWDLISSGEGIATLVSRKILKASLFSEASGTTSYSLSPLHTAIASTFVSSAFTTNEKAKLIAQTISDSVNSSNDNYAYAPGSTQGKRLVSDYARFTGVATDNGYGGYWLSQGGPNYITSSGYTASSATNKQDIGILPMITLDLPY